MATDLCPPILGQHLAMTGVVIIAGEIKVIKMQVDIEFGSRRRESAQPLRHDLSADAVTSNYRNIEPIFRHCKTS